MKKLFYIVLLIPINLCSAQVPKTKIHKAFKGISIVKPTKNGWQKPYSTLQLAFSKKNKSITTVLKNKPLITYKLKKLSNSISLTKKEGLNRSLKLLIKSRKSKTSLSSVHKNAPLFKIVNQNILTEVFLLNINRKNYEKIDNAEIKKDYYLSLMALTPKLT